MGAKLQFLNFVLHFVRNPCFNDVLGKHIALQQEVVIRFQGLQRSCSRLLFSPYDLPEGTHFFHTPAIFKSRHAIDMKIRLQA